jgi:phosphoglycolate phosphatase-like HAD superfamily hydrolase
VLIVKKRYDAFIFDLDGTLVEKSPDFVTFWSRKILQELADKYKINNIRNISEKEVLKYLITGLQKVFGKDVRLIAQPETKDKGADFVVMVDNEAVLFGQMIFNSKGNEDARKLKLKTWGIDPQEFGSYWKNKTLIRYRENSSYCFADVLVLKELDRQDVSLGIVTDAHKELSDMELKLVRRYVGREYFDSIIRTGKDSGLPKKPAKESIETCIEELVEQGHVISKKRIAYVGNEDVDMWAAKNAGIDSILIRRPGYVTNEKPTISLVSLWDLLDYIKLKKKSRNPLHYRKVRQ